KRGVGERVREDGKRWLKTRHPEMFLRIKATHANLHRAAALPDNLSQVVSTFKPGTPPPARPQRALPVSVVSRILWRAAPLQAVPSEFGAQWARYSHLKLFTRREGLHQQFLNACLEKLRRGERPVVILWQDRPVALVWLARSAAEAMQDAGFHDELPPG